MDTPTIPDEQRAKVCKKLMGVRRSETCATCSHAQVVEGTATTAQRLMCRANVVVPFLVEDTEVCNHHRPHPTDKAEPSTEMKQQSLIDDEPPF